MGHSYNEAASFFSHSSDYIKVKTQSSVMERQITHTFYWPEIGGILKGFDDYVSLLQICTKKQDLVQGRYGHANMIIDNMKKASKL